MILDSHSFLLHILNGKGIDYRTLRAALVPQQLRQEYVFAFEIEALEKTGTWNYAVEVGGQLLPVLNRDTTCSILTGQLYHPDQRRGLELLDQYLQKRRPLPMNDVAQLYCVYLNNLTRSMFERIQSRLVNYGPYVGFIPVTFSSPVKTWLQLSSIRNI
jgi:hypothetical protein